MVNNTLTPLLKVRAPLRRPCEFGTIAHMGTAGRYTIILFRDGGEGSGIEGVVDSDDLIHTAHALYQRAVMKRPGRLLMLCDRLHVLARNDRPDAVPR